MQEDFHYYATYCAAILAGYSHEESMDISYSSQFVDRCSKTLLLRINAPLNAATTQLQLEMMDARTDIVGLQDITRIWASFHFLPKDLYAVKQGHPKIYMNKYRLICGPDSDLVKSTVENAKGKTLQAAGIAMHVLADTWAHSNFAGTPSLVINNTTDDFAEIVSKDGTESERKIKFRHSPGTPDDIENNIYTNSLYQGSENAIMNLGHGRAGHLPDYSFVKFKYLPAWNEYRYLIKDNPSDYMKAFGQMVYAMRYLRGEEAEFETGRYADDVIAPYKERIDAIIRKRQLIASDDWRDFGGELSGTAPEEFDETRYQGEYCSTSDKEATFLGHFINAAIMHKGMVCDHIYNSGNPLAGFVWKRIVKKI